MDAVKNFAKATVAQGYDAAAVSINVSAGHGARFPAPPFNAVWWNFSDYGDPSDDPNVEVVRVTAIATDTLTITRAQEGTSASTKNTANKTYKLIAGLTAKAAEDMTEAILETDITAEDAVWTHPRGDAELVGDATYGPGVSMAGMGWYELMATSVQFSKIKLHFVCSDAARDLTFKAWLRDSATDFDHVAATPLFSTTILAANLPHTLSTVILDLGSTITATAGKYLVIGLFSTVGSEIGFTRWTTPATNPVRHGFYWSAPGASTFTRTYDSSYQGTTFELIGTVVTNAAKTIVYDLGDTEIAGASTYTNAGIKLLGYHRQITSGATFTSIECGIWCTDLSRDIELRIYQRDAAGNFNPSSTTPLYSATIAAADFPHSAGIWEIQLDAPVTIAPGKWIYIIFYNAAQTTWELSFKYFTTDGDPARLGFVYAAELNTTISTGNPGYYEAGFRLYNTAYTPIPIADCLDYLLTHSAGPNAEAVTYINTTSGLAANDVQAAIDALDTIVGTHNPTPRVLLPTEIVGVVGDTLQVFLRGIIEAQDPYRLPYSVDCAKGLAYPRYFQVTPVVGDVGTHNLTVAVFNHACANLASASTTLRIVNPTGAPASNKNILCVGDSLTAGGVWPCELQRRLCGSGGTPAGLGYTNLTFLGNRQTNGTPAQKWVGYGGWTWATYLGLSSVGAYLAATGHGKDATDIGSLWVDSSAHQWVLDAISGADLLKVVPYGGAAYTMPAAPAALTHVSGAAHTTAINYTSIQTEPATPFWNNDEKNAFSFYDFITRYSFGAPDAVYVLLGWNGLPGPNKYLASDHTTNQGYLRTFLNTLHTEYPSALGRVLGLQVPSIHGGLAANYGATGSNSNFYKLLRSVNGLNLAYKAVCAEAAYSSWVKFIDTAAQFDSENNMPEADAAVNTRSAKTEKRGTNGVHPDTPGYYQIADAAFRDVIRTFCSA